ncbi:MAG: hypothetical protein LCI00_06230 [Chloroflexi bacterium]|nr:hypothetical protein [Chloroflexota bacterium]
MFALAACQPNTSDTSSITSAQVPTLDPTPTDPGLIAVRATPDLAQLPLLSAHLQRVEANLQEPIPILPLEEGLDNNQRLAQSIAIRDSQFQRYIRENGQPLRNEIFSVSPIRPSDISEKTASCNTDSCYRVEMYNYALNLYTAAVIDIRNQKVLDIVGYDNMQPDIPQSLVDVALEIAVNSPEVRQTFGYTPDTKDAVMASTKTALNDTTCERSRHLCVAPTFVVEDYALWAIVDLTAGTLVGVRWTSVGSTNTITEKSLENESMTRRYCQQNTLLERDGWRLDYILTSSDGLRISDVRYQDTAILSSAKLVDWHVSYSSSDGFGYSDAVGCPAFSQAAVIAVEPPQVEDITENGEIVGFSLTQDFWSDLWPLPCNYYYEQRFEFYKDGRFRPVVSSLGRGCGDDGTYRPVTRLVFAEPATFSEWNASGWQAWTTENWRLAAEVGSNESGASFRLTSGNGGFDIVPSAGQFSDGGRGDNPYIFVTRHHMDKDEGDSDLPTIGPCCNADYQQGPEKFIDTEPESITDAPLVVWYVPQLANDATEGTEYCWAKTVLENGVYIPVSYPCPSGPMFVPLNAP